MAAKKISAKELVADIRAGMSDDDLARKYGISAEGLARLFRQLLDKGLITQSDLERRPPQPRNEPTSPPVVEPAPKQTPGVETMNPNTDVAAHPTGIWYQRKAILVLLLIFFSPIGLYGLYRTSLLSRMSKIIISVIVVLLGIAISPLRNLWLIGSAGCITGYLLYKFLPLGKVPRIAIGTVCGLALVGIIAPWIDKDFSSKTQRLPVQSIPATQTAAPQPHQQEKVSSAQPAPETSSYESDPSETMLYPVPTQAVSPGEPRVGYIRVPKSYTRQEILNEANRCLSAGKDDSVWAIKPIFSEVLPFSEGLAAVNIGKHVGISPDQAKWGFIDEKGNFVIKPVFALVRSFSEGLAFASEDSELTRVRENKATGGFIDKKGKWVIKPFLFGASDFTEGLAAACNKQVRWGFIDKTGTWVIEPQFAKAFGFSCGLAPVSPWDAQDVMRGYHGRRWGYIDKSGNMIFPATFLKAWSHKQGISLAKILDEKNSQRLVVIDNKGNILRSASQQDLDDFERTRR